MHVFPLHARLRAFVALVALALGGLVGSLDSVRADTQLNYALESGNSLNVTLSYYVGSGSNSAHVTPSAGAGPFNATWVNPATPPSGFANSFDVYCVDLYNYNVGTTSVDILPIAGGSTAPGSFNAPQNSPTSSSAYWSRLQNAAWLYNTYAKQVAGATGSTNGVSNRQLDSVALQLAIWNVVDNSNDTLLSTDNTKTQFAVTSVTSGSTSVLSSVKSLTDSYLQNLYQHQNTQGFNQAAQATVFQAKVTNGTQKGQYMIGAAATPEASSLALLSGGLLPVAALIKSRRR